MRFEAVRCSSTLHGPHLKLLQRLEQVMSGYLIATGSALLLDQFHLSSNPVKMSSSLDLDLRVPWSRSGSKGCPDIKPSHYRTLVVPMISTFNQVHCVYIQDSN